MEIKSINISRSEYGPNKGMFEARIQLKGNTSYNTDIAFGIPDEQLLPIVQIIEVAVAENMRKSAEEFTAAVSASLEHKAATAIVDHTDKSNVDD
jgi:hypothetical protein